MRSLLELALPGRYEPKDSTPIGHEAFAKNRDVAAYEIVVDTKGTLLWPDPYVPSTARQTAVSGSSRHALYGWKSPAG